MPIPGPRTQAGPDPGYRNPGREEPTRFNNWKRPGPVWWPGRTPGTMVLSLRGNVLGAGQIRKLWRQSINYVAAQPDYSWTANGNAFSPPHGVGVTRALRYMTRSVYAAGGTDNTRFAGLHTQVTQSDRTRETVTIGAGQVRNRPTVRNRLTSFGSRVPVLNQAVAAAEGQQPGQSSQA